MVFHNLNYSFRFCENGLVLVNHLSITSISGCVRSQNGTIHAERQKEADFFVIIKSYLI